MFKNSFNQFKTYNDVSLNSSIRMMNQRSKSIAKDEKQSAFLTDLQSATKRKGIKMLPQDHNLGVIFNRNETLGPSVLLQQSGSRSNLPKMGDYHHNITRLHKYNKTGPGEYNLPSLFDNYNTASTTLPVKKNPQFEFGIKYPKKMLINKEHMVDMLGVNTPGVGNYQPTVPHTFDEIRKKNSQTIDATGQYKPQPQTLAKSSSKSPGTFTTTMRFFEPSSVMTLRANVPVGYASIQSKLGQVTQAKS